MGGMPTADGFDAIDRHAAFSTRQPSCMLLHGVAFVIICSVTRRKTTLLKPAYGFMPQRRSNKACEKN